MKSKPHPVPFVLSNSDLVHNLFPLSLQIAAASAKFLLLLQPGTFENPFPLSSQQRTAALPLFSVHRSGCFAIADFLLGLPAMVMWQPVMEEWDQLHDIANATAKLKLPLQG